MYCCTYIIIERVERKKEEKREKKEKKEDLHWTATSVLTLVAAHKL